MSRHAVANVVLAVTALALVATVVYLETRTVSTSPTSTAATTTVAATTSTSTTTSTTTTSTTTTTTTTTTAPPTTLPPPARALIDVVVVNGSTTGERLPPTIDLLREAGYVIVRGLVGAVQTAETRVYFLDETFRGAAEVLAMDVGISADAIAPFDDAPPISGRATAQLILYLGGS